MLEAQQAQGSSATPRQGHNSLVDSRLLSSPYLSSEERQALENSTFHVRSIGNDMELLREGERADHFHIITEGWACRYKTTRDGARQIVALLIPGDTANLDSFLFGRLDYGVRTLTAAKVATIPRDRILALADQHPGIARTLAWAAMAENAVLSQWALCLGRQSAKGRLAHLLCEICVRLGEAGSDASFEFPLTQEQIADMLGLTCVHVNRTIRQLRIEGAIESKSRTMTIIDFEALRRAGEFDPAYLHLDHEPADATPARAYRVSQTTTLVAEAL